MVTVASSDYCDLFFSSSFETTKIELMSHSDSGECCSSLQPHWLQLRLASAALATARTCYNHTGFSYDSVQLPWVQLRLATTALASSTNCFSRPGSSHEKFFPQTYKLEMYFWEHQQASISASVQFKSYSQKPGLNLAHRLLKASSVLQNKVKTRK